MSCWTSSVSPSIIVALISLVGLLLQRKAFSDVLKGTVRTLVGFFVLAAGAGVVVGALDPFGDMFQHAFDVQGVVPNNEAIVGQVLLDYGSAAALIFFFGMIVNVLLAATTHYKYIYLSGHVAFYMAAMIAVILGVAGFPVWGVVLWGALLQGLVTTLSPAIVQPFMREGHRLERRRHRSHRWRRHRPERPGRDADAGQEEPVEVDRRDHVPEGARVPPRHHGHRGAVDGR